MKKKFNKIISAILLIASLISVLSVFASASEAPIDEDQTEDSENTGIDLSQLELLYNRTYEDGWDYTNGFSNFVNSSKEKVHKSYIDYEETVTSKYNYFWRIEATDSTSASTTALSVTELRTSGTVVQFKIKADDACNLRMIFKYFYKRRHFYGLWTGSEYA